MTLETYIHLMKPYGMIQQSKQPLSYIKKVSHGSYSFLSSCRKHSLL